VEGLTSWKERRGGRGLGARSRAGCTAWVGAGLAVSRVRGERWWMEPAAAVGGESLPRERLETHVPAERRIYYSELRVLVVLVGPESQQRGWG
jgi:hypothetical protein